MDARFKSYFGRPFPKAEGFSAYRMPGLLVHIPVLLVFLSLGLWLFSWGDPWLLLPVLAIYGVIGLYVGRDLAILAHYNPLITLATWVAAFFLIGVHPDWPLLPPAVGMILTVLLIVVFGKYVNGWVDEMVEDVPPVHRLVLFGSPQELEEALKAGADANEEEKNSHFHQRPLHVAIEGLEDPIRINRIVDVLLSHGADIDFASRHGTPLQLAVKREKWGVARHLLQQRALPNVADAYGDTPLSEAVAAGKEEWIEELIAAGAELNPAGGKQSLLGKAIWAGHLGLVPWLIGKGARARPDEEALPMLAGMYDPDAWKTAQFLLEAGAVMSDEVLSHAVMPEMLRFAAEHGASVERLCAAGKSPIFFRGDDQNRVERLRVLRELGCDLAAADPDGKTLLHHIAGEYWQMHLLPGVLGLLRESGFDVDTPDREGNTALHAQVAALAPLLTGEMLIYGEGDKLPVKKALQLVEPLLAAGADPGKANAAGESALALATRLKAPKGFIKGLRR